MTSAVEPGSTTRAGTELAVPFELFVALRYLKDQGSQTGLILAGIGVSVGVIIFLSALITVLFDVRRPGQRELPAAN